MSEATLLSVFSAAIALLSLGVSMATMYFAWLRRGRLAMTTPSIVFFGFDMVPKATPKIFLRTLLYSTAQRGKMIESMYVKLRRGETEELFAFWGYGETERLTAGGGLYVGHTGISLNHHFVLSVHKSGYDFGAGDYTIQVYARRAGEKAAALLSEISVRLNDEHVGILAKEGGVLFELQPDTRTYVGSGRERRDR